MDVNSCHEQDCPLCPNGWTFYSRNKKCYLLNKSYKTWPDALKFCKNIAKHRMGNLASIRDSTLNEFLRSLCDDYQCHVGGMRNSYGRWIWMDKTFWRFENWNKGEPNNHRGEEHYLSLYKSTGKWNDNNNKYSAHFICQSYHLQ